MTHTYTVTAKLNGSFYEIPCAPAEAQRVRALSQRVDARAQDFIQVVGAASDAELLLLTALTLEDECEAARTEIRFLRAELERLREMSPQSADATISYDQRLAQALLGAAQRIQLISEKLDAA